VICEAEPLVAGRIERFPILIQDASDFALTGSEIRSADRVQMQQLLVNLLRNANEAMMDGNRHELDVSIALLDDEKVEVAVANRGPGLPDEIASHLFEAFRSTKRDGMGDSASPSAGRSPKRMAASCDTSRIPEAARSFASPSRGFRPMAVERVVYAGRLLHLQPCSACAA
jgi:hypothetical protein